MPYAEIAHVALADPILEFHEAGFHTPIEAHLHALTETRAPGMIGTLVRICGAPYIMHRPISIVPAELNSGMISAVSVLMRPHLAYELPGPTADATIAIG